MNNTVELQFIQTCEITNKGLNQFRCILDPWFINTQKTSASVQKNITLIPYYGHTQEFISTSKEYAIITLVCASKVDQFSRSELRIIERAWAQSTLSLPVKLWNSLHIDHIPLQISSAITIIDLGHLLGFDIWAGLHHTIISCNDCNDNIVAFGLRCFSCQLVLPLVSFSGKPLLKIVKDLYCHNIHSRCDNCAANFFQK